MSKDALSSNDNEFYATGHKVKCVIRTRVDNMIMIARWLDETFQIYVTFLSVDMISIRIIIYES